MNTIAGRPAQTQVQVAPGLEPGRMNLSREEGQVLARVGTGASLAQLATGSGLPRAQVEVVLGKLIARGVLVAASGDDAPDLPPERKREIAELEVRAAGGTAFELLGVPNGAPADVCKRAYYDLSMRLHPDRFYGKDLGSYRERIDRLFRKLTEAQHTVTDTDKRAAYQKAHPELFLSRPPSKPVESHDAVRAEDRARRIARHPYLAKVARQHELLGRAKSALAAGQPAAAILDLEQLIKLEPQNAEAKKLLHEASLKRESNRGAQSFDEGQKLAAGGEHREAVRKFLEALEKAPTKDACVKGHESALATGDAKSAKVFAQKWVEFEPRSAKARLALAEVLERLGMLKNAKREAEEALKLDPDNKLAKSLASRLRWA